MSNERACKKCGYVFKVGRPRKIDTAKMNEMLREGKSRTEIAQFFSVTPAAIYYWLKQTDMKRP